MEMERLLLLLSALREENEAAHLLLRKHRLLLSSTKLIMERRIPASKTRVKVRNTCDKATIKVIVAELDKLERIYSPHMTPAGNDGRVRGSLCAQADIPGLGEERGRTSGSLPAKPDVPGPGQQGGCTTGSLQTKPDAPGPGQQGERTTGSPAVEADVPSLGHGRGHTNGSPYPSVDWDNVARLSLTREKGITLSMPEPTLLPVHACSPAPTLHSNENLHGDICHTALKTYNPMDGPYTLLEKGATHAPFGAISGFRTSLGPISFPKGPVKGYILDEDHFWVLHATPPGVRRRGARGLRR